MGLSANVHTLAKPIETECLLEGDCLTLMRALPSQSVDMILCDLPYGTTQNHWDSLIDFHKLWEQYLRILKPSGVVCLTSQGMFTARLMLSMERFFRYRLVWVKSKPTNFLNVRKQPLRKFEDICIFYRQQPVYNPQMQEGAPYDKGVRKNQLSGSYGDFSPVRVASDGQRFPTDVLYFPTAESEGNVWHSTQKPVALGRYLIRTFTNPEAIVLDNAFGSGSFLVAAALDQRRYIGMELNQNILKFKDKEVDLIEIARQRLADIGSLASVQRAMPPEFPHLVQ